MQNEEIKKIVDPAYDEFGGITNTETNKADDEGAKDGGLANKRPGYNFLEKLVLKHSKKINYVLDPGGMFKSRNLKNPPILRLGITNRCSARCSYCPREIIHASGTGYMDFELYKSLIDYAAGNSITDVGYSLWGEPLLHPRFIEMLAYASGRGLNVRLSTNCIVMTNELADRILEYPLNSVEISMDGFSRKEYADGKGVDQYERARNNAIYFFDRAREKKHSAVFNIHFVDAGNVSFVNKIRFVRFWKQKLKGLKYATSFYYEPHNWAGTRMDVLEKLGAVDRLLSKMELKKPCFFLKGLSVNWDGTVIVCGNNPLPDSVLGNAKSESLDMLYAKPKRMEYLEAHEKGTFDMPGCDKCTVNSVYPLLYLKKKAVNWIVAAFS
jgi:MoaA/NifB/PqqE/SkfB family radical SAM enzyme